MQLQPEQIVNDRYKMIAKLGEGGMGAVWKALDTNLDDEVVLKLPLAQHDENILKRFATEAMTMRKYAGHCPFILDIQDVGSIGDVPYYVMRYQSGGTLRDRIHASANGGNATNQHWDTQSFAWLPKIAEALDFLHDKHCFHRDVKPENILFSGEGAPFLADFGVVKETDTANSVNTATGMSVGTFAYMALEVLREGTFNSEADQYALAVTVYETITGERPYAGSNLFALAEAFKAGHRTLNDLTGQIPLGASQAVDRALSNQPEQRFKSCSDFSQAFLLGLSQTPLVGEGSNSIEDETCELNLPSKSDFRRAAGGGSAPIGGQIVVAPVSESSKPPGIGGTWAIAGLAVAGVLSVVGVIVAVGLTKGLIQTDSSTSTLGVANAVPASVDPAVPLEQETTNSIGMRFRLIPKGAFLMGSPDDEPGRDSNENQTHRSIEQPFYIGKHEVTQAQWKSVMGTEPWQDGNWGVSKNADSPATFVSLRNAIEFCDRLTETTGIKHRLPTEAEWEYACRANTTTGFYFGDSAETLKSHAWFEDNIESEGKTSPQVVGLKTANPFGLFDMYGNVWEWCKATDADSSDTEHVVRGGSWFYDASHCRSAKRMKVPVDTENFEVGIRVVRSAQ